MGLLDKWKQFSNDRRKKKVQRATKLVKNPKAIKEDRWASLEFLAQNVDDADLAVGALLNRFEYSLEHGINDSREKELALSGVVKHGKEALPNLETWLQHTSRIAWPIKAIKSIADEKVVVDCLISTLDFEDVSFDQAAVEKNYDILCYLVDYKLGDFTPKLVHFLKDPDERVRFAAVEAILEQDVEDSLKKDLEIFLFDDSSENRRIKQAVATAFVSNNWKVSSPDKYQNGILSEGLNVDTSGQVSFRV